jgi:hypothetical protein
MATLIIVILAIYLLAQLFDTWAEFQYIKDREKDRRRHYKIYGKRKKSN